jgi:hypothetical protein
MSASNEQTVNTPIQINTKQKNRIQKRRVARQKLQEAFALKRKDTKLYGQTPPYSNTPHLSAGCMRCARGPDGRFLTSEEIAIKEMEKLAITPVEMKPEGMESLTDLKSEKPKLQGTQHPSHTPASRSCLSLTPSPMAG